MRNACLLAQLCYVNNKYYVLVISILPVHYVFKFTMNYNEQNFLGVHHFKSYESYSIFQEERTKYKALLSVVLVQKVSMSITTVKD